MPADPVEVMVVEDEPLVRLSMLDELEDAGFCAHEAVNADEAIAILQFNPKIRVIFTDIDMPGTMDGLKLAAYVRDRWPPIKIIVTSGHHSPTEADLPLGSEFFAKPYDVKEVIAMIRQFVAA